MPRDMKLNLRNFESGIAPDLKCEPPGRAEELRGGLLRRAPARPAHAGQGRPRGRLRGPGGARRRGVPRGGRL